MKTSALNSQGEGLVYRDGMVFRRDTDGTLRFESVPFTTGRMTADGVRYHVTDHLGSVRAVIDGSTGDILEASEYSSYGGRTDLTSTVQSLWDSNPSSSLPANRYHFSGKEDQEVDFNAPYTDFGARQYSPSLRRWMVPDPMSEKYYDISPYVYCANDPVNYIDIEGKKVVPRGEEELKMIRNTLPIEAREYLRLNEYGELDVDLMRRYNGESNNFSSLLFLAENDMTISVSLVDAYDYIDRSGKQGRWPMEYHPPFNPDNYSLAIDIPYFNVYEISTKEEGCLGKVLFPNSKGAHRSATPNIEVVINKNLSTVGAAEVFSHEAYGHAYLYLLTGGDYDAATHDFEFGVEMNDKLKQLILNATNETLNNYY